MDTKMRFKELLKNYHAICRTERRYPSQEEFIKKIWTIADVEYHGEQVIVMPTTECIMHTGCDYNGETWVVMGEIVQMPGHYTILCIEGTTARMLPYFFHGSDLQIVMDA